VNLEEPVDNGWILIFVAACLGPPCASDSVLDGIERSKETYSANSSQCRTHIWLHDILCNEFGRHERRYHAF
jgi:hypothetical protein